MTKTSANTPLEVVDNYNKLSIPKDVMFKGNEYVGEAVFLNGYNGFESVETDGILCAVIDNSAWDKKTNTPNCLTNKGGVMLRSKSRRGMFLVIKNNKNG